MILLVQILILIFIIIKLLKLLKDYIIKYYQWLNKMIFLNIMFKIYKNNKIKK